MVRSGLGESRDAPGYAGCKLGSRNANLELKLSLRNRDPVGLARKAKLFSCLTVAKVAGHRTARWIAEGVVTFYEFLKVNVS